MIRKNINQGNKINISFLSPTVLLFFSAFLFSFSLPFLPVKVNFPLSDIAVIFWIICLLSFLVGTLTGSGLKFRMPVIRKHTCPKNTQRFVMWLVIIGFIGTILLIVDRYFIRGVSLAADVLENRDILSDSKASSLSSIAAMMSSLGIISYLTIWVAELGGIVISKAIKLLAILSVLISVILTIQLGSRSLMLVVAIIYILGWFFTFRIQGGIVKLKHIGMLLAVVCAIIIVSAFMMISRTELMGFSMLDSIQISAYSNAIQPNQSIMEVIQNDYALAGLFSGLFSLLQYIFHGFYEFSFLFTNFQGEHENGAQFFWLPIKVASIITGGWIPNSQFDNTSVRTGIFNTFVGPVFIDFGLFSPFFLYFCGLATGIPFRLLQMGRVEWLPAVAVLGATALCWPMVNILTSASGGYLLVDAIVIGLLGNSLNSKSKIKFL